MQHKEQVFCLWRSQERVMKAGGENKLQKLQNRGVLPEGELFAQLVENTMLVL